MPLTSTVELAPLIASLPTVKEAVLAKAGLRALRDAMLYTEHATIDLHDTAYLTALGVTPILLSWLMGPGKGAVEAIHGGGADGLLAAFDAELKHVELIQVTLAFAPDTATAVRFHDWFTGLLKHPLMLDIKVDPAIIGGFTAMYQNHFLDYSLGASLPVIEAGLAAKVAAL